MNTKVYKLSLKKATEKIIKLSFTAIIFLVSFISIITLKYYSYVHTRGNWNKSAYFNVFIATEKYEIINNAKVSTYSLFQNEDKNELKDDVTLETIEERKKIVEELDEGKTKEELLHNISVAKELLANKNFHKIPINYISQNRNKVFNGCEAASILMALNFKGYLIGTSLYDFANDMPKSEDPNEGFYLDIFEYEPLNEAHWIAPEPLIQYAKEKSGYDRIYNYTGYELTDLADEVLNNNPVVIYITSLFEEPYNFSDNGAPANLHVVLLAGYNPISKEYYIIDPWTRDNGQYEIIVNEKKLNNVYTKVGKKSIVIK